MPHDVTSTILGPEPPANLTYHDILRARMRVAICMPVYAAAVVRPDVWGDLLNHTDIPGFEFSSISGIRIFVSNKQVELCRFFEKAQDAADYLKELGDD